MSSITTARYGKENVRVCKVERDKRTGVHTVTEMTVKVLLEGAIESSYTQADNSVIIATDSIKNTVYIKTKEIPVTPPELYAAALGSHFIEIYPHITTAKVDITSDHWSRMEVSGQFHPHAFVRKEAERRLVQAEVGIGKIVVRSGLDDLALLKSTGSQFHGFIRDEYTTLPDVWDRILSTKVHCLWTWDMFPSLGAVRAAELKFDEALANARDITMKVFAEEESASVQNTMYKMCTQLLHAIPDVQVVDPGPLHTFANATLDLSWFHGMQNLDEHAEVYLPQSSPNGLIELKVSRSNNL
ncbi:uricase [Blumeria hordei DH14]|uniref:Uricase n=1 Tax=Blumeria graminis f. sp. hordei (strain DH14) TaxID=546991 RepID=N1JFR7_BLUG1|nr:uricase [Blumeria hordei DH14]